ncbi:hypothetical protein [Leeuwenhoekiella blandensis]|uniref:Uncharacterized protein n=1 Tax=Leeuwenhoekiella blandensis (strain CECT 7118 / CCUG 51940 / KCTC 22103 / MED217) TaxID=398720 RepID=A3XLG4_LEEBM|nr:hypothetical protein [Leeuwenhoekiella blandensis]EAQ49606.1 hypothetical protein MED217_12144 [Leeuwenhoekiella blandensis MED217]
MDETVNKGLKSSLGLLFSITEFEDFFKNYSQEKKIEGKNGLYLLIESFRENLSQNRELSSEEDILLKHIVECTENEIYANSALKISIVNKVKIPNEEFLKEFLTDFEAIKTGDLSFEEINNGKYKTVKEYISLQGVDGKGLSKLYEKYKDFNHPYIYDLISEPIIQAKNYSNGIAILKKSLKYALRYPNYFWHSLQGVDACATSLYRIQFLLGYEGFREIEKSIENFETKLLKLIFLFLSRVIYMSKDNLLSIDAYSNRARIVRDYKYQFIGIFGIGVIPDIQYISDKYLAYTTATKNNLVGQPFTQLMWDSMKMYRHGSHIPNSSGGYQETEDATWMQLVQRGHLRSINLSEKILEEFENYELNFTNSEIDLICEIALKKNIITTHNNV